MKITKETLKQLVMEELKATLDEQAPGASGDSVTQQKANRAIAMANQHLKQVTKIMAAAGNARS